MQAHGLKKCSACQKALAWLAENKTAVDFTDHQESPPSKLQVTSWSRAVGGWEKLINRAGMTWRGLPEAEKAELTETKAVALILKHTSLIRRPLIEHTDGTVTIGLSDKVKALL